MQPEHMNSAFVGAWAVGLGAVALAVDLSAIGGWVLLVGLALLPPLVLLRIRNSSAQSMSESIREVLK